MTEKTILEEISEWFHNFWYGQPEQTQNEGTSTADEAGETTEVEKAGGVDETVVETVKETVDEIVVEATEALPRYKGT